MNDNEKVCIIFSKDYFIANVKFNTIYPLKNQIPNNIPPFQDASHSERVYFVLKPSIDRSSPVCYLFFNGSLVVAIFQTNRLMRETSKVCIRFGLMASFMRTSKAPLMPCNKDTIFISND